MPFAPPSLVDIISGIISLGARGGEQVFIPKIHSVLSEMKTQDKLLAGLWFTITGSTCYSRDIDAAIRHLAAQGVLEMKNQCTAVVRNVHILRKRFRTILPTPQYRRILSASFRFHSRIRGEG